MRGLSGVRAESSSSELRLTRPSRGRRQLRVFGYRNMLVCDAAAMPANPGVNPALTITALAEYAMAQIPAAAP